VAVTVYRVDRFDTDRLGMPFYLIGHGFYDAVQALQVLVAVVAIVLFGGARPPTFQAFLPSQAAA